MIRTRTDYWTCPYCGSNLDPGERCDCGGTPWTSPDLGPDGGNEDG